MNHRNVILFLVPVLLVSVALSTLGGALASHWTAYGTPIREHWPSEECKFKSLQLIYYTNNTSSAVDLEKTGQWLNNTGSCAIDAWGAYVTNGYGNRPIDFGFRGFTPGIEPDETATLWWDLNETTVQKSSPNNWVFATVKAGTGGYGGDQRGWDVFFHDDLSITDESFE